MSAVSDIRQSSVSTDSEKIPNKEERSENLSKQSDQKYLELFKKCVEQGCI